MDAAKPHDPSTAAVKAAQAPVRTKPSHYPEPFASRMAGRTKQPLGDLFGLQNFGVNRTVLAPGALSSVAHAHTRQDEFIYVLEGHPTLVLDGVPQRLEPGMCAGFRAGTGIAHQLRNDTDVPVVYLEIGDRTAGDEGHYPFDDLQATRVDAGWIFTHKDGTPY